MRRVFVPHSWNPPLGKHGLFCSSVSRGCRSLTAVRATALRPPETVSESASSPMSSAGWPPPPCPLRAKDTSRPLWRRIPGGDSPCSSVLAGRSHPHPEELPAGSLDLPFKAVRLSPCGSRPPGEKPGFPVSGHLSTAAKTPAASPSCWLTPCSYVGRSPRGPGSKGKRCRATVLLRPLGLRASVLRRAQEPGPPGLCRRCPEGPPDASVSGYWTSSRR